VTETNDFIGEYRVIRKLGSGGMGEVFLVQHPRLPRRDALKLLDAGVSRDQEFRIRFNREADILAQLRHPNIITVYDRGEFNGRLWLAMEFVDGSDVANLIRTRGAQPVDLVLDVVAGAGAALDYAYAEHRITHRDIKPANILLAFRDGWVSAVKLADFGIAKTVGETTSLTHTGITVGTVTYISPESATGGNVDNRSDLYSLAVAAFEMLTGKPPYTAESMPALMMAHVSQPVPPISSRNPSLPRHLDAVFARALAKDPNARFATCGEFVEALRAAAAAHRPSAGPPPRYPVAAPSPSWSTPRPAPYATTPNPSPAVRPAAGNQPPNRVTRPPAAQAGPPQPPQPVTPQPRRRRMKRNILVAGGVAAALAVIVPTAIVLGSGSDPSSKGSPVDIDHLLLGPAELNNLFGRDDLVMTAHNDKPESDERADAVKTLPSSCQYAGDIDRKTLTSDDVRQVREIAVSPPVDKWIQGYVQFAAEMSSEDTAREAFNQQVETWRACADRNLTRQEGDGSTYSARFSDLVVNDDVVSVKRTIRELPQGHSCQFVLRRKLNYLLYTAACDYDVTDQAMTISERLAERVTSSAPGPSSEPLPTLESYLLDERQISDMVGHQLVPAEPPERRLLPPFDAELAVVPTDCTTAGTPASSVTYANVPWLEAVSASMKLAVDRPGSPVWVTQVIVLTPSKESAADLLAQTTRDWRQCAGQTYRYRDSENAFTVTDVKTPTRDMLIARAFQTNVPTFERLHSLAVHGPYLVEVWIAGETKADIQAITERLVDRLPTA